MMSNLVRRVEFGNALALEFRDYSNRYFGDFHRLLIEVDALITTEQELICLRYQRPLKKMAVVSAEMEHEKALLIEQFLTSIAPYMQQPDFLPKLLNAVNRPHQQIWKRLR